MNRNNELPIGELLRAVSAIEYKGHKGNYLCLDKVQLSFEKTTITLSPLLDTDEIEVTQEPSAYSLGKEGILDKSLELIMTPPWCRNLLGKKLMIVWVCRNDQGYQDQVILGFDYMRPSLGFTTEGSYILLSECLSIDKDV